MEEARRPNFYRPRRGSHPRSSMPQSGYPRNVQIYSRFQVDAPELAAGFMQFGHTTVAELYSCLEICFARPRSGDFRLSDDDGNILSRQAPDHIVPITDLYVISLSIYCSIIPLMR